MNSRQIATPIYRQDAQSARLVRTLAVQSFAVLALLVATSSGASAATPPSFEMIVNSLTEYFKSLPDYQRGDLMNQQQVAAAIAAVAKAGWDVPNAEKITELAYPDNSFLVGEFATPDGKRFMRKISKTPGTYSRLDRLSQLSQGQQVVSQLIGDAGGDVFMTYLATTNSGRNLGQMMAGTPKGTDLNLPTGRIYSADDLLAMLKKAYVKEFGQR